MTEPMPDFFGFPKMARLSRACIITEKIDGTNAQIYIDEQGKMYAGKRTSWLLPGQPDNHGFRAWAEEHRDELLTLGPGRHFGEWWGSGIQRGYGLARGEKRFSLFNVSKWTGPEALAKPACCSVVPVLYRGTFTSTACAMAL